MLHRTIFNVSKLAQKVNVSTFCASLFALKIVVRNRPRPCHMRQFVIATTCNAIFAEKNIAGFS